MEVRKICQWCGKPFIAQKTTTCYCSHQCSNLGYKERIRERKRQLKRSQELLQPRQAAEGQDFFSFAQAAKLIGVTRQYIYKLVKESKLRASRISGKKSLIRRVNTADDVQQGAFSAAAGSQQHAEIPLFHPHVDALENLDPAVILAKALLYIPYLQKHDAASSLLSGTSIHHSSVSVN
mgnify:CR=1 FL=1